MDIDYVIIIERLFFALLAGAIIGLERTYHGHPAGFRTHILVCSASSLLMLFTVFQWGLIPDGTLETVRVDPTRMAQGIMTGIGFLGAGVIMKAGLTIRGLTTAASIWMTASIGIIIGIGLYFAAIIGSIIAFSVLSASNVIESKIPSIKYASLVIRMLRKDHLKKNELDVIIGGHHITSFPPSYRQYSAGEMFEYKMTMRTWNTDDFHALAETLEKMDRVYEFDISVIGS